MPGHFVEEVGRPVPAPGIWSLYSIVSERYKIGIWLMPANVRVS